VVVEEVEVEVEGRGLFTWIVLEISYLRYKGGGYRRGLSGFPSHVPSKGFFRAWVGGRKASATGRNIARLARMDGLTDRWRDGWMEAG